MENINNPGPLSNPGKSQTPPPQPFTAMKNAGSEHKGDPSGWMGTEANPVLDNSKDIPLINANDVMEYLRDFTTAFLALRDEVQELKATMNGTNKPGIPLGGFTVSSKMPEAAAPPDVKAPSKPRKRAPRESKA